MNDIACITNEVAASYDLGVQPRVKPCTWDGEHLLTCHSRRCDGCQPRAAERGYVCQRCYSRIDHALQAVERLRNDLEGIDRAIRTDGGSTVAGPRVPLTAIKLDLEAIDRWQNDVREPDGTLRIRGYHYNLEQWVGNQDSAQRAVHFAFEVWNASKRHPTVDSKRLMKRVRCGRCQRISAVRQPPQWFDDDIVTICAHADCGWISHDQTRAEAEDLVEMLANNPYGQARRVDGRPRITDADRARIAALTR